MALLSYLDALDLLALAMAGTGAIALLLLTARAELRDARKTEGADQ